MSRALVDLTEAELRALLKRLDQRDSMTREDCATADRAEARMRHALADLGVPSRTASANETIALSLVGEPVRVETVHGRVFEGELEKVTGFRSIIVKDEPFSHPVNLSLVKSIQAVDQRVAA